MYAINIFALLLCNNLIDFSIGKQVLRELLAF
jgi:hypothetical protein